MDKSTLLGAYHDVLPFLRKKNEGPAVSIATTRQPDGSNKVDDEQDHGLMAAAEALISAVHAKDSKAVAAAFKDAFEICESQPHEEYEADDESDSE